MKAVTTILYLCGGLMAAAAVMGAIDYKVAEHKGSLKKLYKEEERPLPMAKKVIDIDDYSRGEINRPMEKEPPKETKNIKKEKPVVKIVTVKHEPVAEDEQDEEDEDKTDNKKRIKFSEFSRAPLPRKHYEAKKTVKATVDTAENKTLDY